MFDTRLMKYKNVVYNDIYDIYDVFDYIDNFDSHDNILRLYLMDECYKIEIFCDFVNNNKSSLFEPSHTVTFFSNKSSLSFKSVIKHGGIKYCILQEFEHDDDNYYKYYSNDYVYYENVALEPLILDYDYFLKHTTRDIDYILSLNGDNKNLEPYILSSVRSVNIEMLLDLC